MSGGGAPCPLGGSKDLKDDATVALVVDGVSYFVQLLFADFFVVVADSADGAWPLLSEAVLDVLLVGQRMELRFQLAKMTVGQPAFDGIAVVDLQAGRSAVIAAVRPCGGALSAKEKLAIGSAGTHS